MVFATSGQSQNLKRIFFIKSIVRFALLCSMCNVSQCWMAVALIRKIVFDSWDTFWNVLQFLFLAPVAAEKLRYTKKDFHLWKSLLFIYIKTYNKKFLVRHGGFEPPTTWLKVIFVFFTIIKESFVLYVIVFDFKFKNFY